MKVVIIIGGVVGMGFVVVERFVIDGWFVVIFDVSEEIGI